MKTNILRPLFDAGQLWQGNTETTIEVTDTGFPELNIQLCGQGWPAHMLIEFLTDDFLSTYSVRFSNLALSTRCPLDCLCKSTPNTMH